MQEKKLIAIKISSGEECFGEQLEPTDESLVIGNPISLQVVGMDSANRPVVQPVPFMKLGNNEIVSIKHEHIMSQSKVEDEKLVDAWMGQFGPGKDLVLPPKQELIL